MATNYFSFTGKLKSQEERASKSGSKYLVFTLVNGKKELQLIAFKDNIKVIKDLADGSIINVDGELETAYKKSYNGTSYPCVNLWLKSIYVISEGFKPKLTPIEDNSQSFNEVTDNKFSINDDDVPF